MQSVLERGELLRKQVSDNEIRNKTNRKNKETNKKKKIEKNSKYTQHLPFNF